MKKSWHNIKGKTRKIWDSLKGKKRNIGTVALFLFKLTVMSFPDLLSEDAEKLVREFIDYFLIGGGADAMRRSKDGQQIISKTKERLKNSLKINNNQK